MAMLKFHEGWKGILACAVLAGLTVSAAGREPEIDDDLLREIEALEREWEQLEREFEAMLKEEEATRGWIPLFAIETGAGYNDNVLRGSVVRESAHYGHIGFDFSLLQDPRATGGKGRLMAFGETRQYFENGNVSDDYLFGISGEWVSELAGDWSVVLPASIDYNDEYADVSTEFEFATVRLRGLGLDFSPGLRYELSAAHRFEGKAVIQRQFFRRPLDDYWETGAEISWRHIVNPATTVEAGSRAVRRRYDTRPVLDADGAIVEDSRLELSIYRFGAGVIHYWDEDRRWRSRLTGGLEVNRDNGDGFFDYLRPMISHRLLYAARPWRIESGIRVSHYRFDVRRTGENDSRLRRSYFSGDLRGEFEIHRNVSLFVEYRHENVPTNEARAAYCVNTVLAGMEWLF